MFDQTHTFVPGHFNRRYMYTVNCYYCEMFAKNATQKPNGVRWKRDALNPTLLNVIIALCNKSRKTV